MKAADVAQAGATAGEPFVLRRVGPGFPEGSDDWHDDGYARAEDEFFENPAVNRAILWAVIAVIMACVVMFAISHA